MLVVADIDKKKVMYVLRKTHIERRKMSLLRDEMKILEEKVIKLVVDGIPNLW